MASLMGLWELKEWVDNESAGQLFDEGIKSLEVMLPSFTIPWWTLYDIDPNTPFINVNSPRYHSLILSYIRILNILHPSKALSKYMDIWSIQNRPINQVAALGVKTARKLIYR
jgi:hypothetical protein